MIAFVRMTYSLQAHVRAFGRGPYRNEEKRDKRTCWRKKRLGGTFPGIRNRLCPFISATITSPYKLILLLGVKRATPRQTPHVALSVTFSCPSVYSYCKPSAKRHFMLIH